MQAPEPLGVCPLVVHERRSGDQESLADAALEVAHVERLRAGVGLFLVLHQRVRRLLKRF